MNENDLAMKKVKEQEEYLSFMEAYKLTGQAKLEGVKDFMENLIENDVKFLLFAHHTAILDEYENFCIKKAIKYIRIDGQVPLDKRHYRAQDFQTYDHIRCALLSITACAMGLTLTAASTVLFAENTWTPAMMIQAEDRAHRIGQKQNVNIYYLHGAGTVDEVLFQMI